MAEDPNSEVLKSLIAGFVEAVPGIIHAAAIASSAGFPLACSEGFPPDLADQLAAVTSGLTSLLGGASRMLGAGSVVRGIVAMERGMLIVTPVNDRISFSALAAADCDLGLVTSEMAMLGEQAKGIRPPAAARLPRQWSG